MSESINVVKIKEDKTHVWVTFENMNDEFMNKLQEACLTSERGFEVENSGVVKFKHLTSKTYAESQARKLIRETLATMSQAENTQDNVSITSQSSTTLRTQSTGNSGEVVITDIHMPFFSMVGFMIKWAIAAIPAFIILYIIGFIFSAIFGSLFFFGSKY